MRLRVIGGGTVVPMARVAMASTQIVAAVALMTSAALVEIASAADVPVVPTKLIVVDKLAKASKAKTVFVAKDAAVTKGAGVDVNQVSVTLDVVYGNGSAAGAFVILAGSANGWLANKATVAKYVNKDAPGGPTEAKVAVIKPGKLLKLVGKGLGDAPLDILGAGDPAGSVQTAYCVDNAGEENCHCSTFTGCLYKSIAGGTGAKLVCKTGTGDPTCSAVVPATTTTTSSTTTTTLPPSFHYIFVTSQTYDGNLGGLAGADSKCQARAAAASLPGVYGAFLSATGLSAPERFGDFELRLTDDVTVVANDKADLLDGSLDAAIAKDESGVDVTNQPQQLVWTATNADFSYYGQNCNNVGALPDWSTTTGRTVTGFLGSTDTGWLVGGSVLPCNALLRLYCIQQ